MELLVSLCWVDSRWLSARLWYLQCWWTGDTSDLLSHGTISIFMASHGGFMLAEFKTVVSPLLTHWRYCSLAYLLVAMSRNHSQRCSMTPEVQFFLQWVDYPHKGIVVQSFDVLFVVLAWTSFWTNNGVASDLRHHDTHVMSLWFCETYSNDTLAKPTFNPQRAGTELSRFN